MEVVCIVNDMEHFTENKKYVVYSYEKEKDNIWIKDDKGGSDCYSEEVFLYNFKWI